MVQVWILQEEAVAAVVVTLDEVLEDHLEQTYHYHHHDLRLQLHQLHHNLVDHQSRFCRMKMSTMEMDLTSGGKRNGKIHIIVTPMFIFVFRSYESANGIKAEETGDVKNKGSDNAIQTVQGSYSYTSPEGQFIEIKYTADENGFLATGKLICFFFAFISAKTKLLKACHFTSFYSQLVLNVDDIFRESCWFQIKSSVKSLFCLGDLPTPVPLPEANLKALAEFEAAYATGELKKDLNKSKIAWN